MCFSLPKDSVELASACSEKACSHAVILHAPVRCSSVVLRVCPSPGVERVAGSSPAWSPLLPAVVGTASPCLRRSALGGFRGQRSYFKQTFCFGKKKL